MKKTKKIALTAILSALYFVLSAMLKIPVGGNITLDLGYISLMVGSVFLGAESGMTIGALGAFLESAMMSRRGISPGWIMMNALVGFICGRVLSRVSLKEKRKFVIHAVITVFLSMLLGVAVKTVIDCVMYDLAFAAKIPSGFAAWLCDSIVMLVAGMPLCFSLKDRL